MIKIQASVSKGWLHKQGGFEFDHRYYNDPFYRMQQDKACHDFIRARFPDYPIYNMEDNLVQAEYVVPDMMVVGAIQPNMIIAAALGAGFVFTPDKDSDIKGFPLKDISDENELLPPGKVLELPFVKRLEEQFLDASRKYPRCRIIPPFFWDTSGRATIHGIITTSMKFIGQDIYVKMLTEPDLTKAIHQWITEVYVSIIKHFSEIGDIPVTSLHVGECSGTMLNEDDYRQFVLPYLNRMGDEFGAVRLHSCGNSDHIMDTVCEVRNLQIIDTGSDTSIAKIRDRMGSDFEINIAPPLRVLIGTASEESMKDWLNRILEDNSGGNLKIEYHLEPDYNLNNCLYIHEELYRRGLVKPERLY